MWDELIEVLHFLHQKVHNPYRTRGLVEIKESFNFVFIMKMMLQILCITSELSLILKMKDEKCCSGLVFGY